MEDNKTEQMREYLRLKKLQDEDKSEELIEDVYNKVATEKKAEEENER